MIESRMLLGCVEQAATEGIDPLVPPISVSLNGSLAKWRDKIQLLDLRINDPGLTKFRKNFEDIIQKAHIHGIEVILTLPEWVTEFLDPPPPKGVNIQKFYQDSSSSANYKLIGKTVNERTKKAADKNRRHNYRGQTIQNSPVVWFKPCYLAVSRSLPEYDAFETLTIDDCIPIIDLATRYGIKHIVVPVSEPGLFLDPIATEELRSKLNILADLAKKTGVQLHLRTGGLSLDFFKKINREIGCGLAFNIGTANLERMDLVETYIAYRDHIQIIYLHQVLPGLDKWKSRREAITAAIKAYKAALNEYKSAQKSYTTDSTTNNFYLNKLLRAWHEYKDALQNPNANLGLFQSGEINFRPILRCIKEDLDAGFERFIVLETVPNMRDIEFLKQHLLPNAFTGTL